MTHPSIEKTSRILDSVIPHARELFRTFGYKKTTVGDIASGVFMSKKTLYAVFHSKNAILRETIWRDTVETIHTFEATLPEGAASDTMILSLCRFIFTDRIKRGKKGYFWGLYSDDDDIRRASREALKRIIRALYDDGLERGLFKPVGTTIATEHIVSMIITAVEHFPRDQSPVRMFNDTLAMIADAVAYKNRIPYETMA